MRDIVIVRELPHAPEVVWEALTNSKQLAEWLMPNDFVPVVGHRFTFRTDPAPGFDGIVRCEVLVLEAPTRLEISWRGGPLDTRLRFELTRVAGGTRLLLRHSGFRGASNLLARFFLGVGWRRNVGARLSTVIERARGGSSGAG